MLSDYLAAEAPIIARIESEVTGARHVFSVADLATVSEKAQQTPAVHVIYDGDVIATGPRNSAGDGAAQVIDQRWLAVVAVRNVSDQVGGRGTRTVAGPLIVGVIQALAGWAPGAGFRPMVRVGAPRPVYRTGFAYFPLAFQTRVITT